MPSSLESLPLFPLSSVLFPRGLIGLRIFESRYLDMVRERLRTHQGFGIVANLNNQQGPGGHALIGTEAMIIDFSTLEDGLLGLQCRGHRRFRIHQTTSQDNGLLMGEVEWLAPEAASAVRAEHATLQSLMREMLRQEAISKELDIDPDQSSDLGFGLASILPLSLLEAQHLLEITDPEARLDHLMHWVQNHADALEA